MKKRKQGKGKPVAKLPAGFSAIAAGGEFGAWHDFEKNPVLQGKVIALGSFTGEYGKKRTMTVQNGKVLASFSESTGTAGLFDIKGIKGKTVYVRYEGTVKVGKKRKDGTQKTFKRFTCAVKD